jgi:hypothetical protein
VAHRILDRATPLGSEKRKREKRRACPEVADEQGRNLQAICRIHSCSAGQYRDPQGRLGGVEDDPSWSEIISSGVVRDLDSE